MAHDLTDLWPLVKVVMLCLARKLLSQTCVKGKGDLPDGSGLRTATSPTGTGCA